MREQNSSLRLEFTESATQDSSNRFGSTSSSEILLSKPIDAKVLIVEDNLVNLEIAKTYLEQLGCTISVARDGREAIDRHAEMKFDLIFMDCKMPGMDGFDATTIIRRNEKSIGAPAVPIVALTANAFKEDRENCEIVGMDDFLPKPFSAAELHKMLEKHLDAGKY